MLPVSDRGQKDGAIFRFETPRNAVGGESTGSPPLLPPELPWRGRQTPRGCELGHHKAYKNFKISIKIGDTSSYLILNSYGAFDEVEKWLSMENNMSMGRERVSRSLLLFCMGRRT